MKKPILVLLSGLLFLSNTSFALDKKIELRRVECSSQGDEDFAPLYLSFSDGLFTDYVHMTTTIGDDSEMTLLTAPISKTIKDDLIAITSDDEKFSINIPTSVRSAERNSAVASKAKIKGVGNIENYTFKCSYNNTKISGE